MAKTQVPAELLYTADHEWLRQDGDTATVGITDFAQSELGDIVFVELPAVGSVMQQGQTFGTVEAVKTVADLLAPASGQVVEVNTDLADHAEQVNQDPYGSGWMVRIRLTAANELAALQSAEAYAALLGGD